MTRGHLLLTGGRGSQNPDLVTSSPPHLLLTSSPPHLLTSLPPHLLTSSSPPPLILRTCQSRSEDAPRIPALARGSVAPQPTVPSQNTAVFLRSQYPEYCSISTVPIPRILQYLYGPSTQNTAVFLRSQYPEYCSISTVPIPRILQYFYGPSTQNTAVWSIQPGLTPYRSHAHKRY